MKKVTNERRKFIRYSTLGALGLVPVAASTAAKASTSATNSSALVYVEEFGAVADGVTDDTAAIQLAIDAAIVRKLPLALGGTHLVSSSLTVSGELEFAERANYSEIVSAFVGHLFAFSGDSLRITGLRTSGVTLVKTSTDFEHIRIDNCDCTGLADSVNEYLMTTDSVALHYKSLTIDNNRTLNMSGVFADGMEGGDLFFTNNYMLDSARFILRVLKGSGTGNVQVNFQDNHILGMNSSLTDTSIAARVVQVDAEHISVVNNFVRDLQSTTAANLLYFRGGDLNCLGNTCINAYGTEAWIHDKGVEGGTHVIKGNSFDQSGVTDYDLDAVIKIYTGHNFTVSDNEFYGLKSPACWVYESVTNANVTPQQNVIANNQIRSIQYPFAFKLVQPSSHTVIKNNTLFSISNPDSIVQHGESVPKFMFIYVSVNNGESIENVAIDGNVMFDSPSVSEFIKIYRHTIAITSDIKNLFITNNTANDVSTFCKFVGQSIESCTLANNVGKAGCVEYQGSNLPTSFRTQNNLF